MGLIRIQVDGTQIGAYRDRGNALAVVQSFLATQAVDLLVSISTEPYPAVVQDLTWLSVAIDTGHGGADPGAVDGVNADEGDNLHTLEKVVNYQTGLALIAELQARGARVVDLRAHGGTMELCERSEVANQAKVDLLISLHANAAANVKARGFEMFYYSGLKADSIDAQVATTIEAEVRKIIPVSRGVRADNLHMLRETTMPAVLCEAAFLTNPNDERLLNDPTWIAKYAKAIADGVSKCKEVLKRGNAK